MNNNTSTCTRNERPKTVAVRATKWRINFRYALVALLVSAAIPVALYASNLAAPNSFTSGTQIWSSDMNANFTAIRTAVNDNDARITAFPPWAKGTVTTNAVYTAGNVGIGTLTPSGLLDIVQNGDELGRIYFQGHDGAAFNNAAAVSAAVDAVPGAGNVPGALMFSTSPNGGFITERMRISNAGSVGIGTSSFNATDKLTVNTLVPGGRGILVSCN